MRNHEFLGRNFLINGELMKHIETLFHDMVPELFRKNEDQVHNFQ